jgi:hypothetical protein
MFFRVGGLLFSCSPIYFLIWYHFYLIIKSSPNSVQVDLRWQYGEVLSTCENIYLLFFLILPSLPFLVPWSYNKDSILNGSTEWSFEHNQPIQYGGTTNGMEYGPTYKSGELQILWLQEHAQHQLHKIQLMCGMWGRNITDHDCYTIDRKWLWTCRCLVLG